jgi:hypothetical protein
MADLPSAVFARLTADAGVSALVGTRVYPGVRPQGSALPAIRYGVPTHFAERDLEGATSVRTTRLQFDCFALTAAAAWRLGEKVIAAMQAPAMAAGVIFSAAEEQGPIPEPGADTPEGFTHWTRVDLLVRYRLA